MSFVVGSFTETKNLKIAIEEYQRVIELSKNQHDKNLLLKKIARLLVLV